jgi:hypothetical protein
MLAERLKNPVGAGLNSSGRVNRSPASTADAAASNRKLSRPPRSPLAAASCNPSLLECLSGIGRPKK